MKQKYTENLKKSNFKKRFSQSKRKASGNS
ncbi:unknown protein [Simkania negevensis Z]|uniref:Uncharacterized protein n=1 Tax=Simkania negevensis (strain ATCC VR-1471 / DSM 27360 / Z) TaxID=331113 RepID=F8L8M4_SIMNZ|nr:unknown protein [Simkania negevensis Z]